MPARHVVIRFLVAATAIAGSTVYMLSHEPVRGVDLHSRLLSTETLPREMMESCTWDTAVQEAAFQQFGDVTQRFRTDPGAAAVPGSIASRMADLDELRKLPFGEMGVPGQGDELIECRRLCCRGADQ